MGPTRCTSVALSYKGSEADSKLGDIANNGKNIASGGKVWGCCLGIFDLTGGNGPLGMSAMEACLWPTRCTPVALGFKGSEWGSRLGPVTLHIFWSKSKR